jgi:putative ubiquitin-RnfH superfamily antitoxin RatB of RatAB toxin-antitoxin module
MLEADDEVVSVYRTMIISPVASRRRQRSAQRSKT